MAARGSGNPLPYLPPGGVRWSVARGDEMADGEGLRSRGRGGRRRATGRGRDEVAGGEPRRAACGVGEDVPGGGRVEEVAGGGRVEEEAPAAAALGGGRGAGRRDGWWRRRRGGQRGRGLGARRKGAGVRRKGGRPAGGTRRRRAMVKSKVTIGAGEAPAHPGHVARKLLGHAMLVVSVATGISAARVKLPRRPRSCLPGFFADVSPACRAMPCCCYAAAAVPLCGGRSRLPYRRRGWNCFLLFAICCVPRCAGLQYAAPPPGAGGFQMKRLTDDSAGSGITTQQARAVQLPKHVTPPALTCPSPLGCLPRSAPLLSLVCSGAVQPCRLGASAPTVCRLCRHPPCPSHLSLYGRASGVLLLTASSQSDIVGSPPLIHLLYSPCPSPLHLPLLLQINVLASHIFCFVWAPCASQ